MTDFVELFTNLDYAISVLKSIEWYWVLLFAFLVTFIENLFPPSPSDVILLFMGSLVALGNVTLVPLLFTSTAGSVIGFLVMYYLGKVSGHKIIESRKISFITNEALEKPKQWFNKYGYYIIIANRFLSGTRAVISFLAGMSELSLIRITALSAMSALLWNFILIYLGIIFSNNLDKVQEYITLYGKIIFPIIIISIIFFSVRYIVKVKRSK